MTERRETVVSLKGNTKYVAGIAIIIQQLSDLIQKVANYFEGSAVAIVNKQ